MLLEEFVELKEEKVEEKTSSFNHSYLCWQISQKLSQNAAIAPLPELTLNIGSGLIPDISVFPIDKIKPDFLRDVFKFPEMPVLAIEVVSASQNIQDLLEKAQLSKAKV